MTDIRYAKNIEVLQHLKQGTATPEMLHQYSGWGGLREAIYTPEIYRQLKRVLTEGEIQSLKQTLTSAYYTPVELVQFIYQALKRLGFRGGRVLEPAAGIGTFLSGLTEFAISETVAVELDQVTCRILQALYPQVQVQHAPFQTVEPGQFDLIIGNPPYGSETLTDSHHPDLSHLAIHHYFVAKCMRLLKTGGVLAMVLPSYFLDNETQHARDIIRRDGGNLLAAFRLPDNLFANAKVTVDVVFLYKGQTEQPWLKTSRIPVGGRRMAINEYYLKHPTHIIGQLEVIDLYGRKGLTCRRSGETYTALSAHLSSAFAENHLRIQDSTISRLEIRIAQLRAQVNATQQELNRLLTAKQRIQQLQTQLETLITQALN